MSSNIVGTPWSLPAGFECQANATQLLGHLTQGSYQFPVAARARRLRRSMTRVRTHGLFYAAHACVQEITHGFEFLQALERHLRACIAAGGLYEHTPEAKPPLHDVRTKVDILNARVIHNYLAAKKNSPPHRDSFVCEFEPHGVVAEPNGQDQDRQ